VAVRVWLPTLSAAVLKDAWPAPFTGRFDAQTVDPSVKLTVPTGRPAPDVVVEVKVTDWPKTDGLGEALAVVVVTLRACTVCTVLPVLAAKFGSAE